MTAPQSFIGDMEETYERLNNKIEDLQLKVDEVNYNRQMGSNWNVIVI